jgi:anaerobic selenocysteine-containing dehydrogenase
VVADAGPQRGRPAGPGGRRPPADPTAREADLHLAVRGGTNLALLNAIQHELFANGWVDRDWVAAHTVGVEELERLVAGWPPERAAEVCGVDAGQIRGAARILGTAQRLLSTVLQGVYQSHQATAAACQVNNLNLLRGMIGRPGCAWVELSAADADRLGVAEGDQVRVESRRGAIQVPARVTGIDPGTVFVPFHYADQAAKELARTAWDPVSKQPQFKTAAVRVARED